MRTEIAWDFIQQATGAGEPPDSLKYISARVRWDGSLPNSMPIVEALRVESRTVGVASLDALYAASKIDPAAFFMAMAGRAPVLADGRPGASTCKFSITR